MLAIVGYCACIGDRSVTVHASLCKHAITVIFIAQEVMSCHGALPLPR